MTYARKSAIQKRGLVVPEIPPVFDNDGMDTLAGALCLVAAGAHSKNAAEQEQIAAQFWACAISGFDGIRPNDAVTAFVRDLCDKAKRK